MGFVFFVFFLVNKVNLFFSEKKSSFSDLKK